MINIYKKKLIGKVIKNKMHKSATICIDKKIKHKIYKKFINKRTKIHIHDENNICNIGDIVLINECKPISKTKSWNLLKIINNN